MRTVVRIGMWGVLVGLIAASGSPAVAQPAAGAKSKIKITVPQANAELKIEGTATKATGLTRDFETPGLDPAKLYEYLFEVSWRPNNYTEITRKKTVQFKGGEEVVVDLTKDDGKDRAKIRYVPTPDDIVAQMVKLAGVGKDDIVFEPGCGDSRITIAAVKAGAKKGVGIDLDPERVTESKANVKAAGLGDKIDIRLGDALDIKDLGDATVVFLYMGDEFDALIRPILWKQLKVGTRIVSHRFTMGDWKSDKSITVKGEDGDEYLLHLWTITEDVKKKAEK